MYQEGIPCQIPLGAQSEEDKLNGLLAEYAKLLERLDKTVEAGKLDPRDRYTVVQMLKKVTDVLAARYKNVRKGVDEVMGGRILDYPGRKELHAAEARGKLKAFADLVRKGFLSLKDASSELNMTEAEFNNDLALIFLQHGGAFAQIPHQFPRVIKRRSECTAQSRVHDKRNRCCRR